ncbi:hypothetical protein AVEN_10896-1 [Araneus ventricosus]|uniref:Uncharacterized protein n=1 Tax=Araneus ventricosus TaxID=182803 RepID=A0A4Y2WQ84_ARAVE|nr:hypothetical protein AVEN_10896-1 [Araneus ventricosus]
MFRSLQTPHVLRRYHNRISSYAVREDRMEKILSPQEVISGPLPLVHSRPVLSPLRSRGENKRNPHIQVLRPLEVLAIPHLSDHYIKVE